MPDLILNPFTGQFDLVRTLADMSKIYASCTSSEDVGHCVRITSTEPAVRKVDISDPTKMPAMGIITAKPTATTAVVQLLGELRTTGLVVGAFYYIDVSSRLKLEPPARPLTGSRCYQAMGHAITSSRFWLSPSKVVTKVKPNGA